MPSRKKIALGTSAAALTLVAGLGVAGVASAASTTSAAPGASSASATDNTATDNTAADNTTPESTTDGPRAGHRGDRGALAAGLASTLGLDEDKVTEAIEAFREANRPAAGSGETGGATKPDPFARDAELAASLAETLGLEESKVAAALEELRSSARTERAEALETTLDAAVGDGTLTQAEADAVTKAIEKGVIGGGR